MNDASFIGELIGGDFDEGTMTFEIEGAMSLRAGRYKIIQFDEYIDMENKIELLELELNKTN